MLLCTGIILNTVLCSHSEDRVSQPNLGVSKHPCLLPQYSKIKQIKKPLQGFYLRVNVETPSDVSVVNTLMFKSSEEAVSAYVFLTSKYDPYASKSSLSDSESDLLVDLVGSDNCGISNAINSVELYRVVYTENWYEEWIIDVNSAIESASC